MEEQINQLREEGQKKDTEIKELLLLIGSHEASIEEYKANKKKNNALILELEMMLGN